MAWSKEMSDEVDSFFDSTPGKLLLAELAEMQRGHNNLQQVMNEAQSSDKPDLIVAKHRGMVEGFDRIFQYIESVRSGDLS